MVEKPKPEVHTHTYFLLLGDSSVTTTENQRKRVVREMYITCGAEIFDHGQIDRSLLPEDLTELDKERQAYLAYCEDRERKDSSPKS